MEREEVDVVEVNQAPEEYTGSVGHRFAVMEAGHKIYMREVYREEPPVRN